MKNLKALVLTCGLVLALSSASANAWFFFFIPGGLISKIGDAISGAEGDNCVSSTAKVGDVLTSAAGNTAKIKSISGPWDRCKNPAYPIRALLEFNYSFSPDVGMDLPDGFKPRDLTPTQRYDGALLSAYDNQRSIGLFVFARPRKPGSDGRGLAHSVSENVLRAIDDGKTSDQEELTINGLHAYRFQVIGKNKGVFGETYTYVVTVLEGKDQYVILNANCRSADFADQKATLQQLAFGVKAVPREQQIQSATAVDQPPSSPAEARAVAVKLTPESGSINGANNNGSQSAPDTTSKSQAKTDTANTKPLPQEGIADRLRTLEKLLKEGLITQDDYENKKRELLKQL